MSSIFKNIFVSLETILKKLSTSELFSLLKAVDW